MYGARVFFFCFFWSWYPKFLDPSGNQCPKPQLLETSFSEPACSGIKPCVLELGLVSEPNGSKNTGKELDLSLPSRR